MQAAKGRCQFIPVFFSRSPIILFFVLLSLRSPAFSLLGPFTDWMYATNGYHMAYDIGGPMNINEGYRWNVPVVTYGFDKSFLDYFGSNGVAAVEGAIQILNNLPPASSIALTNYPTDSRGENYAAAARGLYDLKSATLALLIEQLGLTQPSRNIFDIRQWTPALVPPEASSPCGELCFDWAIPTFIIQRNFDPVTLAQSSSVDEVLYSGYIHYDTNRLTAVVPFPVDPVAGLSSAVADTFNPWDLGPNFGAFYTSLTRDDVGGIRFLLNQTNVNYENLLPRIYSQGTARRPINGAFRPGVEKITFIPHLIRGNGTFSTTAIPFTDTFITNGVTVQQKVRRIVHQPDFLFSANSSGASVPLPLFQFTGTTNWVNNAALNGQPTNAGPGVIRPPVKITFQRLASLVQTADFGTIVTVQSWGSFDESTNAPIVYPTPAWRDPQPCTVELTAEDDGVVIATNRVWQLTIPLGTPVALQLNTTGTNWTTVATVTNTGGAIAWVYQTSGNSLPLFNVVPAP